MLKKTFSLLLLAGLLVVTVPVSAQQITAPTAPETRSPQSATGNPIEDNQNADNLQSAGDRDALDEPAAISFDDTLPPAENVEVSENNQSSLLFWILTVLIVAIVLSAVLFLKFRSEDTQTSPLEVDEPPVDNKPAKKSTPPKPKNKPKSKKRARRKSSKRK